MQNKTELLIDDSTIVDGRKIIRDLGSLRDEIDRLMFRWVQPDVLAEDETGPDCEGGEEAVVHLKLAKALVQERRTRDRLMGEIALFGEPAWDIMLDLFIARLSRKNISVSSACIGSASPQTTALRYLSALEKRGLIERAAPTKDRRVIYVMLSDRATSMMTSYFRRIAQSRQVPAEKY